MGGVLLVVVAVLVAVAVVVALIAFRTQRALREGRVLIPAPDRSAERVLDVADPYKLVRSRHGWMLANPNDAYLGRALIQYGECCELEIEFLLHWISLRPGVVVEVGANIGTHTVPLAKALASQNRRLVAFEPQPVIFQNLCANLALNALQNVVAWPNACSDEPGVVYFSRPDYFSGGNFGGVSMASEASEDKTAVPCVTLDSVVGDSAISLLKVDVEGFELRVLRGAAQAIAKSRPVIYVENDRVEKSKELIEWLWSKDYRLWWHFPLLFNPQNFFADSDDRYQRVASINMLCLPKELDRPVAGLQEVVTTRHPLEGPA
ncbi:MAG: FkbM family methyltransferase [Caldimonas sp.]